MLFIVKHFVNLVERFSGKGAQIIYHLFSRKTAGVIDIILYVNLALRSVSN